MHKLFRIPFFLLLLLCSAAPLYAQMSDQPVEMADMMRSNGKIYVVVAVLTTVLAGIVFFLIRLERRIRQLEKE